MSVDNAPRDEPKRKRRGRRTPDEIRAEAEERAREVAAYQDERATKRADAARELLLEAAAMVSAPEQRERYLRLAEELRSSTAPRHGAQGSTTADANR